MDSGKWDGENGQSVIAYVLLICILPWTHAAEHICLLFNSLPNSENNSEIKHDPNGLVAISNQWFTPKATVWLIQQSVKPSICAACPVCHVYCDLHITCLTTDIRRCTESVTRIGIFSEKGKHLWSEHCGRHIGCPTLNLRFLGFFCGHVCSCQLLQLFIKTCVTMTAGNTKMIVTKSDTLLMTGRL